MADSEYNSTINIRKGDFSGPEAGKKAYKDLGDSAERANQKAKASGAGFTGLGNCIRGATNAMNNLRAVMTGFGIVGIINQAIALFQTLKKWIGENTEEAKKLREEMNMKSAANQVKEVAAAYKGLTDAIAETNAVRAREKEVFDEEVRVRREAQDEQMKADELDALAEVDPNAEDAEQKRQRISRSFAARRARLSAERKKEDVVFRRQELTKKAEDSTKAANSLEASLDADDKAILRYKIKASTLEALSKNKNEHDGTWYNPHKKTDEGNAERERLRKEAEKAREEVKRLEEDRKSKEKQIANLRAEADQANKIKSVLGTSLETADLARENANVEEDTKIAAEKAADSKKAAKEAREAADLKAAQDLLETGGSKASSYRRDIQANNERIVDTQLSIATGKTGKNAGAKVISELQRQNDELNELLSALLKSIDQSKRTVERANQRMRNAQGVDSTEGA